MKEEYGSFTPFGDAAPPEECAGLRRALTDLHIIEEVEHVLSDAGLSIPIIVGQTKRQTVAVYRHWLMYVVSSLTKWSSPVIGNLFQRDHTTVLNGVSNARELHAIGKLAAPIPKPMRVATLPNTRESIVSFISDRADEMYRRKLPGAAEVERVAGIIRRGDESMNEERDTWRVGKRR